MYVRQRACGLTGTLQLHRRSIPQDRNQGARGRSTQSTTSETGSIWRSISTSRLSLPSQTNLAPSPLDAVFQKLAEVAEI